MAQNDNLLALQSEMAARFGAKFGWHVSDTFFTIAQLRQGVRNTSGIDDDWPVKFAGHSDFYVFADGTPAAVTGHQYDLGCEAIRVWAHAYGLRAAFPDFISWWNPPRTRLVVYFRRRVAS